MKIKFFKLAITFVISLILLIIYLTLIGIETEKFNKQIKDKVSQINKNLDIDLNKIKLTLDPLSFKINAKTVGTKVYYSNNSLELEHIKTQVSLASIIKNKFVSSNIELGTRSILVKDLVKFARAVNNSPKLFLLEKIIKNGHIIIDLNINFDENGNIKNDYKVKGSLKDGKIKLFNQSVYKNINFKFNIKNDNFNFQEIQFNFAKINFFSNLLKISKKNKNYFFEGEIENKNSKITSKFLNLINLNIKDVDIAKSSFVSKNNFSFELNNNLKVKNIIFKSDTKLNNIEYKTTKFIDNYFPEVNESILFKDHQLKINFNKNQLFIKGKGKIKINEKLEDIDYLINKDKDNIHIDSNLIIGNIIMQKQEFLNNYFPLIKENINFKDHKLNITYKNKKLSLSGAGKVKINNDFDFIQYHLSKREKKLNFDLALNLNKSYFKIDYLNYTKKNKSTVKLNVQGNFKEDQNLNLKKIIISENNNEIEIFNLLLDDSNLFVKVEKAKFNYIDKENKKNNFYVMKKNLNTYEVSGTVFNANSLISNFMDDNDKHQNKILKENVSINLNLEKVHIDDMFFINNFNGKILIKNNKVVNANISAVFENNKTIKLTVNTNNEGNKITTLNSTWAKPLINRYKFIRGFEEGYLDFYSSKKNGISNSVLIVDNFRVKEVPALAKLLTLASLQGIADLLTGEGVRFTDLEMRFSNNKKLMTIEELYAIGPSISILMEGYIQSKELISLRGTLVPASTINRSISSIPLIGDLLIGKKVGEGVFGVSFKIKGPPKNLETSVNPIKTLTPRFITRTLEKIKKN